MIYYTQLIYIKAGKEDSFLAFEEKVLPLLQKYNGKLIFRFRPTQESVVSTSGPIPYEVHLVGFDSKHDLANYANDETRKRFLHLKEDSIERVVLIEGEEL